MSMESFSLVQCPTGSEMRSEVLSVRLLPSSGPAAVFRAVVEQTDNWYYSELDFIGLHPGGEREGATASKQCEEEGAQASVSGRSGETGSRPGSASGRSGETGRPEKCPSFAPEEDKKPSSSLSDLPSEVLEMVSGHLGLRDTLSLFSTCRRLRAWLRKSRYLFYAIEEENMSMPCSYKDTGFP